MSERNVLFLVHRVPYPPNRGDRIRSFHLLKQLQQQARVWLAFLHTEPLESETLPALEAASHRVAAVPLGRMSRWAGGCGSLARGQTATEGLFASEPMRRQLRQWAAEQSFDAVVVFCSSMAQYADLPELANVPLVVDLVDVDSQKWFDYAGQSAGPKRWLYQLEGRRLRRLEQALGRRAQAVLLVSQAEADLYSSFASEARVLAAGNGVDLNYFQPDPEAIFNPSRCVFVGALDYRANIDAVRWFVERVWPTVRKAKPAAEFVVVGRDPSPAVQQLVGRDGIRLEANVPDVRPHVLAAAVMVAPLRVARGIQNKVLEAMALGRPVLATPQALEGIELTVGEHALAADSPESFASQLLALMDDPARRDQLGHAGRQFVEQHHTWDARLRPLTELMDEILGSHQSLSAASS